MHTLFLDDEGHPLADVVIACDDLDYLVFAEGPSATSLAGWLHQHAPAGLDAVITDSSATHQLLGIDGPYAWEWLGRLVGPEVVGMPYLGLFTLPAFSGQGLRFGKTGEFGYDLLLPRTALNAFALAIQPLVEEFSVSTVGIEELDLCALENGFFSIRSAGVKTVTPVELQLQWRLDHRRNYPGQSNVDQARHSEAPRVTWFRGVPGQPPPKVGDALFLENGAAGHVFSVCESPLLGCAIGQALLARPVAHPGLELSGDGFSVRSVSAPLLRNRSLYVSPQRHGWASRDSDSFPSIVPP